MSSKKCLWYSFIISEGNGLQILPEILTDHGAVWNLQNLLMKKDLKAREGMCNQRRIIK